MTTVRRPSVFRLRLQSVSSDDRDEIHRLRALLKLMKRRFGYRCVEITREQPSVTTQREKVP
jgi:hypothetical protein